MIFIVETRLFFFLNVFLKKKNDRTFARFATLRISVLTAVKCHLSRAFTAIWTGAPWSSCRPVGRNRRTGRRRWWSAPARVRPPVSGIRSRRTGLEPNGRTPTWTGAVPNNTCRNLSSSIYRTKTITLIVPRTRLGTRRTKVLRGRGSSGQTTFLWPVFELEWSYFYCHHLKLLNNNNYI